jgi:hypothetical protein
MILRLITLSITPLSIVTLALSIMPVRKLTVSIMILGITALSIVTLSKMTLGNATLGKMAITTYTLIIVLKMIELCKNINFMPNLAILLNVVTLSVIIASVAAPSQDVVTTVR